MRSPGSILRAEHLIIVGLFYWILLDAVQGAYSLFPGSAIGVRRLFIGIALFACSMWLGSWFTGKRLKSRPAGPAARSDLGVAFVFSAGLVCWVIGTQLYWIACDYSPVCIYQAMFLPRFEAPWRGDFMDFATVFMHLTRAAYLTLPLAIVLYHLERRVSWRVAFLLLLSGLFLLVLIRDGGRREIGAVLGAGLLIWLLLRPRIRWRHLLATATAAALVLLLLQSIVAWRDRGLGVVLAEDAGMSLPSRSGIAVDRNLAYGARLMSVVPYKYPHSGLHGVAWTLTQPIPSSVFPPKRHIQPRLSASQITGKRYGPGYSWTASAIADLWLMAGYGAIALGGLLFGGLAARCSLWLQAPMSLQSALYYSIGSMALFIGLRALHNVLFIALSLLALWGLFTLRGWLLAPKPVAGSAGRLNSASSLSPNRQYE